ncbi:hypothetical protein F5Y04DRAFT_240489 [Hypomontagnella monticulosa]|nr:hypothetical protein F5Y04DRAFT_240489 [Hypomontagnella monticulosa]
MTTHNPGPSSSMQTHHLVDSPTALPLINTKPSQLRTRQLHTISAHLSSSISLPAYRYDGTQPLEGASQRDIYCRVEPRNDCHAGSVLPFGQDNSITSDSAVARRPNGPIHQQSEETPIPISIAAGSHTPSIDRIQSYQPNTRDATPSPTQLHLLYTSYIVYILQGMKSLWVHVYSSLDIKITIRFIVVIFSHFMGIATAYSVGLAPSRAEDALSSTNDDGFPLMVAQVAASLLSPLLFAIISTRENSIPLRQKIISFYYILLVVGVFISFVSLLLYSLWPSGYRVTNATIMASLMFTVLGGWQFLEKCWDGVASALDTGEDIELGSQQA